MGLQFIPNPDVYKVHSRKSGHGLCFIVLTHKFWGYIIVKQPRRIRENEYNETHENRCSVCHRQQFCSDITVASEWARRRLKWPASPLFTQPFIGRRWKKTSKLRVTGFCAGNSPGTGEFLPLWQRPVTRKMFLFDDVIMVLIRWNGSCCFSRSHHMLTPCWAGKSDTGHRFCVMTLSS